MSEETARRLSELFHEAGLLDRLGESIPGLVYVYDLVDNRNVFTNRPLAALLGYLPEQVRALGAGVLSSLIHPDDMHGVGLHHAAMRKLADGEVVEIEFRVRTPEGSWRWLHSWESVLTRDETGQTRQFLGIAHEVTARVRAEEELRESQQRLAESEQRWRSIAENPFDFVVVIDRNYKYTFVNFAAPGVEMEALIGKATPFDFVAKEHHPTMQAAFDAVFDEGRANSYDVYIPTLDKWYSSIVGPIRDGEVVTHASVLTRDITAEKRVQEQARRAERHVREMENKLAQSAKLEAVGRLAGGIAHDFNNLLTGISAITELLAHRFGSDESTRTELDELREAVTRGTGLTRQLLAFSRQQPIASSVIALREVFEETARMLRRLIGEDIELDFLEVSAGLAIRADRTQMGQVLLNLALNARDAMPNGGRLGFSATAVEVGEDMRQENPDARSGSYVRLRVEDSGAGMDAATLGRIFEPFFTTKPIGAGTGLGLALVHGIVHQSGGFIQVRSALGQGSRFDIYLPRCAPAESIDDEPKRSAPRGSGETVLLVEDDPLTRRVTLRLLEHLGYRVDCAERGDEALQKIESGLAFDVLLTDILLPGLDGHSLYQRASRLRPGLVAVLMSGYTAEVLAGRSGLEGAARLQKPFSHQELAETLRLALERRQRR